MSQFLYNIPIGLSAADLSPVDCVTDFRPSGSPEHAEDITVTLSAVASSWWVPRREATTCASSVWVECNSNSVVHTDVQMEGK